MLTQPPGVSTLPALTHSGYSSVSFAAPPHTLAPSPTVYTDPACMEEREGERVDRRRRKTSDKQARISEFLKHDEMTARSYMYAAWLGERTCTYMYIHMSFYLAVLEFMLCCAVNRPEGMAAH